MHPSSKNSGRIFSAIAEETEKRKMSFHAQNSLPELMDERIRRQVSQLSSYRSSNLSEWRHPSTAGAASCVSVVKTSAHSNKFSGCTKISPYFSLMRQYFGAGSSGGSSAARTPHEKAKRQEHKAIALLRRETMRRESQRVNVQTRMIPRRRVFASSFFLRIEKNHPRVRPAKTDFPQILFY